MLGLVCSFRGRVSLHGPDCSRTHYVVTLLPQPPACWVYKYEAPHLPMYVLTDVIMYNNLTSAYSAVEGA